MKAIRRIGLIAATGALLSGCSLFSGNSGSALSASQQADPSTAQTVAEIQLEVGRENLSEGNLATAARYLAGARMHPETRADAANALGVVYVRLGRLDVAQRYFQEALEVQPDNARFATNLARLEGDVSFARAKALETRAEPATEMAQLAVPVAEVRGSREARVAPRQQRHVIHIQTSERAESEAPQMEIYKRRPVVQMVEREETQGQPVEPQAEVSQAKVIEYPVRVEI